VQQQWLAKEEGIRNIPHTDCMWGGEWGGSSKNNLAKEFGKDTVLSLIFTLQIASDYH